MKVKDNRFCNKCGGIEPYATHNNRPIDPGKTIYYCVCKLKDKDAGGGECESI